MGQPTRETISVVFFFFVSLKLEENPQREQLFTKYNFQYLPRVLEKPALKPVDTGICNESHYNGNQMT